MRTWADVAWLATAKNLDGGLVVRSASGLPFLLEEGMEVAARLGRDMAWMVKVLAESRVPVPESTPRPMMNFIR